MVIKSKYRGKLSQGAALFIVDLLFFGAVDPDKAPSFIFMVAFLLVSLTLYWLASSLYQLAVWYGLPLKHRKRAVVTSTGVVMSIVALQSTGQLSVRDIVLVLPFVVVGYFYLSYQQRAYQS